MTDMNDDKDDMTEMEDDEDDMTDIDDDDEDDMTDMDDRDDDKSIAGDSGETEGVEEEGEAELGELWVEATAGAAAGGGGRARGLKWKESLYLSYAAELTISRKSLPRYQKGLPWCHEDLPW